MEGQERSSFLFGGGSKKLHIVLQMYFWTWFSIPAYYNSFGYWKLSQHQCVLSLWWSSTVATMLRPLKSVVQKYISPRINLCLHHCCCKLCVFVYCRILLLEQSHYLFVSLIPRFQIVMGMEIDSFSLVFLLSALWVDHSLYMTYYEEITKRFY